ncbi:MAG TPA: hypothetical protein VFA53_11915 [Xanthobacteraceae bacterium]|nr:hypothetical protein [Xanthobacteraceae bacterium]
MADKTTLGMFGLVLAGVTVAVTVIAFMVVRDAVASRMALDGARASPGMSATAG